MSVNRELWKALIYFWESRRLHANPRLCKCSGKTWEGPKCSPLADLEALCKQEVKAKTEVETAYPNAESVPKYSHRVPQQRLWSSGCHVLVKFLSHHQLTTKLNEQRLPWPKVTQYTDATEKSLNKKATNPGLGGNPIPELPHYTFLNVFNKNSWNM